MDLPETIKKVKLLQNERSIEVDNLIHLKCRHPRNFEVIWCVANGMTSHDPAKEHGVTGWDIEQDTGIRNITQMWLQTICAGRSKPQNIYQVFDVTYGQEITEDLKQTSFRDFLSKRLFPRLLASDELGLPPNSKLFSIAPGAKIELVGSVDQQAGQPQPVEQSPNYRINRIAQYKKNLIDGIDIDIPAIALGDMSIADGDDKALSALWEAICETHNLDTIINPCAFTIGRIVKDSRNATLEDTGFKMFEMSRRSEVVCVIDRFAHTVGQVARNAWKDEIKQRAIVFIFRKAENTNPIVRDKYTYVKKEFLDWLKLHHQDRRGESKQTMGELVRRAEETLRLSNDHQTDSQQRN